MQTQNKIIKYILEDSHTDIIGRIQPQWFTDLRSREIFEAIKDISTEKDYVGLDDIKTKINLIKRPDLMKSLNSILEQEYIPSTNLHLELEKEYTTSKVNQLIFHLTNKDATLESSISKINEIQKQISMDADEKRIFDLGTLYDEYVDAKEKGIPSKLIERSITLRNEALRLIFGNQIMPMVYGIGARPGFRKTDLLVNLLVDFDRSGKNGIFVSFEDNRETLRNKFIAIKNRITKTKINEFTLTDADIKHIKTNKPKSKITIIEKRCGIDTLRNRIDQLAKINDIDFILIDYIQLFKFGKGKRHEEMGQITKEFMDIANTYMVPIMFNSQVNVRDEGKGGSIQLTLGDFKESGDIEADVRHAVLIQGERAGGVKVMNIAKNTWGPIHMVNVEFDEKSGYLLDPEDRVW
ncbi:MAG TPA: hypothetical protein ENH85_10325 [Candidatus Scalindua sp.]|nr:hypothetical protein [Candidatus Scalindua sp.]